MNYWMMRMMGLVPMEEAVAAEAPAATGGDAPAPAAEPAAADAPEAGSAATAAQPSSLLGGEPQNPADAPDAPDADSQQSAGAPEAYEAFAVPEGYELHEAAVPMLADMFKELNLPQDKANALVAKLIEIDEARNPTPEQIQQAQQERITQLNEDWGKMCRDLPELGGENFDKSLQVCSSVMTRFGTQEVRDLLTYSGLGSNPHFFKFVHAIGMSMQEDTMVHGGDTHGNGPKSVEKILWPNQN